MHSTGNKSSTRRRGASRRPAYEFYERRIYPHLLDVAMLPFERYRKSTLEQARGNVLEIGFGMGRNLPFYPPAVTELTGFDPMTATSTRLKKRLAAAPFPVHRHVLAADAGLPFESGIFDCATVTWTLCTIPDPVSDLREVIRVLRPGAPLLFVEHGASPNPRIARWQERLNGAWRVLACGCNLNRAIDRIIEDSGFKIEEMQRFNAPGVPRTHGHLYRGIAIAPHK